MVIYTEDNTIVQKNNGLVTGYHVKYIIRTEKILEFKNSVENFEYPQKASSKLLEAFTVVIFYASFSSFGKIIFNTIATTAAGTIPDPPKIN